MDKRTAPHPAAAAEWLVGGGRMGELIRSMDWSETPLGPIDAWPQSLRTTVSLALSSNFPISIAWGPQRTQPYNDGYWPICGGKHPESMGQDFKECWFSAWPAIGEAFESATSGTTAFLENQRMFLDRHGYLEETFFTFSFSPIRDETGRVAGLFHPVTEMTAQTLAERRLGVLRDVSDACTDARTVEESSSLIVGALERHALDVPFALLYLLSAGGKRAELAGAAHVEPGSPIAPKRIELTETSEPGWPIGAAIASGEALEVSPLQPRFGDAGSGPYPEPPNAAMLLPITVAGLPHPLAVLIAGVSPRRVLDEVYRTFYLMLQDTVRNAIVNARSYEEERKRAEALAELDRAKTAFFSNVSHEFRTPLTLMLGPLEDALSADSADTEATAQAREPLAVAHRNALRLLKLVNSLLDFSRIEAGRVQASYEPTDLAALTAELASNFRSACERAGLRLTVDCAPMPEPVYVDRDMWEKIVLNLLSNAFKFTFEGGITVSLRARGGSAELAVLDSGVGIPAEELPRLFERFHRVEGAQGRTHEGTGIGLALVQELVKLHGGTISADSAPGAGATLTAAIPFGSSHLPADRIGSPRTLAPTSTSAAAYVEEALRWLPNAEGDVPEQQAGAPWETVPGAAGPGGLILVVDDNADMRDYIGRLLKPRFDVLSAPDGDAALEITRHRQPDLVLSDIMMPKVDGFELLRRLRADDRTRGIPVILLSARAGEESRIEGLDAGADDYLIKPFSARELVARVDTHLKMAKLRRESELAFRTIADTAPVLLWMTDADNRCTFLNRGWYEYTGQSQDEGLGTGRLDAVHPDDRSRVAASLDAAAASRQPFACDYRLRRADGEYRWVIDAGRPRFDEHGAWLGHIGSVIDVHERKQAEDELRESRRRLKSVSDHVPDMISYVDRDGYYRFTNARYEEWFGKNPVGRHIRDVLGEAAYRQRLPYYERVLSGEEVRFEGPTPHRHLGPRETEVVYVPDFDERGETRGFYVRAADITDRKRIENALRQRSDRLSLLWEAAGIILTSVDADTMLTRVFSRIGDHLGADTYAHFMVDESGDTLRLVSSGGISEDDARRFSRIRLGEGISGKAALARAPVVEKFIQHSEDAGTRLAKNYSLRACACYPLIADGRLLGTLAFGSRTRDEFTDEEIQFIETISHYVTAACRQMSLIGKLRDADRRKDEFLATLAHELRNPLAPINTSLHLLRTAPDSSTAEQSLAVLERQTRHLNRLVDDLLEVSRITQGKLRLREKTVTLAEVVDSALDATRWLIEEAGHELTVSLPDEPVWLHADLTRLAQVFANLLSNAAKYTAEEGRIRLEARRENQDVLVTVSDNGIGIPTDMLQRVFEMFTQIDRTHERGYPGLGVGLTLVRSLVALHGGSVGVRSDGPGRGSEFTVRLPCAQSSGAEAASPPAAERREASVRRVLVVDDNADAADMLGLSIELLGHDVRKAADGFEAVEIAAAFRPDVVLMDLGMPRMGGIEAARRIRAQPGGDAVKLVALTGWGQTEDKQRSREAGFDLHVIKPLEPSALEQILRGAGDRNA